MKLRYLLSAFQLFVYAGLLAQSDFDLSQRWFNEAVYNPAATANSFTLGVNVHSRAQWLNTDGAPVTNVISVDNYFDDMSSAVGLVVITDKIGYINSWSAKINYAYFLKFEQSALSIGLSGALMNRNKSIDNAMADNPTDVSINNYSNKSEYSPDFDFGIEYKGAFKAGLVARHLLASQSVNTLYSAHNINLWAYASSRFNASDAGKISLEPILAYTYRGNISRIEGGLIMYFLKTSGNNRKYTKNAKEYNDKFWLGGVFQYKDQVALLAGISITSHLSLGYAFNYGITDLSNISGYGTHELYLSWKLNKIFYKTKCCPAYRSCKN